MAAQKMDALTAVTTLGSAGGLSAGVMAWVVCAAVEIIEAKQEGAE